SGAPRGKCPRANCRSVSAVAAVLALRARRSRRRPAPRAVGPAARAVAAATGRRGANALLRPGRTPVAGRLAAGAPRREPALAVLTLARRRSAVAVLSDGLARAVGVRPHEQGVPA